MYALHIMYIYIVLYYCARNRAIKRHDNIHTARAFSNVLSILIRTILHACLHIVIIPHVKCVYSVKLKFKLIIIYNDQRKSPEGGGCILALL